MTRVQQLSYLKAVAVSLKEYSKDAVDRDARVTVMKAMRILEQKVKPQIRADFYLDISGLKKMKISKDTRHKLDLMIEFAGKDTNTDRVRDLVKKELKRLTKFKSVAIDEMLNDEIYLKRFHFIFG